MGLLASVRTGADMVGKVYRVTRVNISGQFADDVCFRKWFDDNGGIVIVSWAEDPGNDGGPNDHRYYTWLQAKEVPLPTDCQLTLLTSNGANGWATQAEAEAVMAAAVGKDTAINAVVVKANEKALDPLNWNADGSPDKPSEWGWVKWVLGGAVVVGGIYSVAKLVRG